MIHTAPPRQLRLRGNSLSVCLVASPYTWEQAAAQVGPGYATSPMPGVMHVPVLEQIGAGGCPGGAWEGPVLAAFVGGTTWHTVKV